MIYSGEHNVTGRVWQIIRYPNRRCYCNQESRYVKLDEILKRIREGGQVSVHDRESGQDITREYLLAVLTHRERHDPQLSVTELQSLLKEDQHAQRKSA